MSRTPEKNKEYMKRYLANPKKREEKQKRERDLYKYEKKNGKLPKGKELDHKNWNAKWPVRVISKTKNRQLGAKTTLRVRKKVN